MVPAPEVVAAVVSAPEVVAAVIPAPQGDAGGSSASSEPVAVASWDDAMPRGGYMMPYKTHGTHTCEHNVTQEVLLLRGGAGKGHARGGLLDFDICSGMSMISSC